MRKLTLLFAFLFAGVLGITTVSAQPLHKFSSKPHAPIASSLTTIDQIYVPTNVPMTNVRIGVNIKSVYYSTLRIVLNAPSGEQIILMQDQAFGISWYGSLGHDQSYALFQDGGNTNLAPPSRQPNDRPIAPFNALSSLNNKNSMGWWTLVVTSPRSGAFNPYQEGFLEGWTIMFNSVTVEPEVSIWSEIRSGSSLMGYINGRPQVIPNEQGGLALCSGNPNTDPAVVPGRNGDAFPFIVSVPTYPGLLVGAPVPGFTSPGRFKVTLNVATNQPPPNQQPTTAFNDDIAVYFGKAPSYTPPLTPPASPLSPAPRPWPTGSGNTTNALLPTSPSGIFGGVRLVACGGANGWPATVAFDAGGFLDLTFDDLAIETINNAQLCGAGSGLCDAYRPQQPLSNLNGVALDGLYYVTVHDAFGESAGQVPGYGQIRVLSIRVDYLAGGGQVANPLLHQGIAGPLYGVPLPGAATGGVFGYLPAVISGLPPHSIHAKDQDPILVMWGTQKVFPRTAVGYERIQFVTPGNTIPSSGTGYHGPYAYPGTLDANPTVAGVLVNADLRAVPTGDYRIKLNLMQQRYDNDNSDNEFWSYPFKVSQTTQAYYGNQNVYWTNYQNGAAGGFYATYPMQLYTQAGGGIGVAFSVFKNPTTKVTSIDYKHDVGYITNLLWRTTFRISIWRCANGFVGAPTGARVAMSPTVPANEYFPGNWRTYPLYACDAQGNITSNASVDLAPGTYVVMLDNMSTSLNATMYPYTYGAMPHINDRYKDNNFSEGFGPIAPFSTFGNRLQYQYTPSTNSAPTGVMTALASPSTFGNLTWPMRMNFTNLNDFAINFVSFSGLNGPETLALPNAPFVPSVNVTANSLQGGNTKDFNARLEIFDGANSRVYIYDSGPVNINGYQTVSVPCSQWNPSVGGFYKVKAWFSRNPDDQNPVNDVHEFNLYVSNTRAILATGESVDNQQLNNTLSILRDRGIDVEVMNSNDPRIASTSGTDIYLLGSLNDASKNTVAKAIENGNDVAFVYDRKAKVGQLLKRVDHLFEIDRGANVNYDKIDLFPELKADPAVEAAAAKVSIDEKLLDTEYTSKEDLLALAQTGETQLEIPASNIPATTDNTILVESLIPVELHSGYGDIEFIDKPAGDIGFIYAIPSVRKSSGTKVDKVAPLAFELGQNYPNPFNPSTTISYTIASESVVALRVLDMLGREVMTLINEAQKAGSYTVTWKGLDQLGQEVASGNYFYRIDATPIDGGQPFSSMKKMMLSK